MSQRLQIGLAELGASEEAEDGIGDITELDQQVEGGHEQQEYPGEQCSGSYEERPERPASHPTQHRRSHRRRRNPCHHHDDPGHARSEPSKQRPHNVGHGFGGVRETAPAHRPVDPQRGVD
ncbi:MAG TPA: hypothetical protein VF177_02065 [Anaerolineae bacterium]